LKVWKKFRKGILKTGRVAILRSDEIVFKPKLVGKQSMKRSKQFLEDMHQMLAHPIS
jgi:hypothetical protein